MRKVNARDSLVRQISPEESIDFLREHHRQGLARPGKNLRGYGIFLEGELLGVALFCNPRTRGMQKRYTTELFRLAFKEDVRVRGGASKLIKHFMATGPWDLFTYQDTAGEATDVYELAGMKLAGPKNPKKKILVKDGISHEQAENNHRDWFSMEQVVFRGPDALIGTELGTVFEEGKRVSNLNLFLRSGYHLEEVPGDRIYEWHNPAVKFYTYKITNNGDERYYFGRRAIRGHSIGVSDCLLDGYMGSGGKKFQAWVTSVGIGNLTKEIVAIYDTWAKVLKAEEKLIGDRHLTDPLCMNFQPGGVGITRFSSDFSVKDCLSHGASIHLGDSCRKCSATSSLEWKECPNHGISKHQGEKCKKCIAESSYNLKECPKHGEVLHRGDSCCSCSAAKSVSQGYCEIHGESKRVGDLCKKCIAKAAQREGVCDIHGISPHQKDSCVLCVTAKAIQTKNCSIHGETKHRGNSCYKCSQEASVTFKECPSHGRVRFQGKTCVKCTAENTITLQECSIHGETKHQRDRCRKCLVVSSISLKLCDIHGEVKHRGNSCMSCSAEKTRVTKAARKNAQL